MFGICSARRASQKSITQSAVNFGNCKRCYSEKRGEGKGDRIDTFFLTEINTRGIAWQLALVSRSSQTELTLERSYFWLLHYAPCPEKLWHLHPPTTYTTALVFHSVTNPWAILGFLDMTISHFHPKGVRHLPEEHKLFESARKRGWVRPWLLPICSPFAEHLLSDLSGSGWTGTTPRPGGSLRLASPNVPDGRHEVWPGAAGMPKTG